MRKCYDQKLGYVQNKGNFMRKLKNCYSSMTDSEVFNFIRIYLMSSIDENNFEARKLFMITDHGFQEFVLWVLKTRRRL